MAQWAKIKFFYETMLGEGGSTLSVSSVAAGDYSVSYVYNMLETNMWKASSAATPQWLTYDAGAGNAKAADYLAVIGHNLSGVTVDFQYSDNGADFINATPTFVPADNNAFLKEFSGAGAHRWWRIHLQKAGGFTTAPYLTIAIWGNATELDYATAGFDPHEQEVKANVSVSETGYLLGIHHKYVERSMSLKFEDADADLYAKVREWWEANGLKNFFVVWEGANSPDDVFLMRPDAKFSNPLKAGGLYRDITISMRGRKE